MDPSDSGQSRRLLRPEPTRSRASSSASSSEAASDAAKSYGPGANYDYAESSSSAASSASSTSGSYRGSYTYESEGSFLIESQQILRQTEAGVRQSQRNDLAQSSRSVSTSLLEDKENFEWNEKFQLLLDSVPTDFISSTEQFASVSSFCFDLLRLSKDFVHLANLYGKIIISEKALSEEAKTIKPIPIGGFAGGRKYLKRGILFKFPQVDEHGIYAGVDEWAAKAGGHELKGLIGFKMAGVHDLRLPLLALIDYRGYRLCAVSALPINKETLVYGSDDGAKSVVNRDTGAATLMEEFGRRLNLKKHQAGRDIASEIVGPADIEVHKGTDGRYYVIDHARVFPPEAPSAARNHLFNHLRPEFVKKYPIALSSDGFSRMTANAADAAPNNDDIRDATKYLVDTVIPEFAEAFEEYIGAKEGLLIERAALYSSMARNVFKKAQKTLCEELHRFGINLRYLGIVRMHATSDELRKVILVEMISRVLKINLRKRWRQQMEKFPSSETESFKHVTAKYLNLSLGTSDKSSLYWAFELIPQLINKFKDALTKAERTDSRRMASDNHLKRFVLLRMSLLCGISFSPKFIEKLHQDPEWFNQERPVPELHIISIEPCIKTTNTISYVEGLLLLHSARRSTSGRDKTVADQLWILKSAARKFKEAVRVAPGGRAEILALSYVLFSRASLNITIEKAVRLLDMAQHKLRYLLKVFPGDPVAFVLFADVVQLSGIFRNNIEILQDAASHYQKHLQTVPHDSHAYLQCGKLYLYIYYYAGKVFEILNLAHNMARKAVEINPDDGEAWHLLARVLSLQVTKDKDPSTYALCDDAFSRAHLLLPSNVYILYRWGRFLLRKSKTYENFDTLLTAAMKLKAAIEKQPKIDHYNDVRECLSTLEEKIRNSKQPVPVQTFTTVTGWIKIFRQAVEKWNQQHKSAHGDSHIIDWEDIDIIESLGQAEFKFVFKATWHPNKNSLAQSTGNLFERVSPPPMSPETTGAPQSAPNSAPHSPKPGIFRAMSSIFSTPRASKEVAVKVLKRNNALQSDKARFENELKIFSHIGRHPNICSFYGVSYDENHIAIVREYFQFGSALHYLDRNFPNGPNDDGFWDAAYRIILDVAEGLSFLHQAHVLLGPLSIYQAYMSDKNQTKLSEFNNAVILQPDDGSAEMQIRGEVTQFAVFLWEVGARKTNAELPDHVVSTPAALPIDEAWPDAFKQLIRSCSRPDIEPKLTMREVVLRVKNIMFGYDADGEAPASSSNNGPDSYAS